MLTIGDQGKLGRITDRTETVTITPDPPESATRHFEYDDAGRLWRVCDDDTCSNVLAEYLYDANGNRNDGSIGSDAISTVVDDQDRLLTYTLGATTHTYTYSENGELNSKIDQGTGETSYTYDAFSNLRSVVLDDGGPNEKAIEYLIDGRNRRVGKKVNGTLVQQLLYKDQLNPVAELDGAGNLVAQFVYGSKSSVPDYMTKDGGTYRILSDDLGSVRLAVRLSDGFLAQRLDYDEFGTVLSDTNPGCQPFGFAGGVYDGDTNLVRFSLRDYDSRTGRWDTKDPIRFAAEGTNSYSCSKTR